MHVWGENTHVKARNSRKPGGSSEKTSNEDGKGGSVSNTFQGFHHRADEVTSHLKTHKTGIEFNGGVLGGIRR